MMKKDPLRYDLANLTKFCEEYDRRKTTPSAISESEQVKLSELHFGYLSEHEISVNLIPSIA